MLDVRVKEGINTATRHLGLKDFIKGHAQPSGSGALTKCQGTLKGRGKGSGQAGMTLVVEATAIITKLFFWMVTKQAPRRPCFPVGPLHSCSGASERSHRLWLLENEAKGGTDRRPIFLKKCF